MAASPVVPVPGSPSPKLELPGADSVEGAHNTNWDRSHDRILSGHSYKDCGVICIVPSRGKELHWRFVQSCEGLIKPPNHPFAKWPVIGMEVGDAYNRAIWQILANPDLMKWNGGRGPIVMTVEDDNLLPADALMKLLESFHNSPYAAISALYWTKGESGVPQLWGEPKSFPVHYAPQVPRDGELQEVRGIGQGCALFDIALFQDPRTQQGKNSDGTPIWFKTWAELDNGVPRVGTQDLSFCEVAQKAGYRFAVDTRVRVGHLDKANDFVW